MKLYQAQLFALGGGTDGRTGRRRAARVRGGGRQAGRRAGSRAVGGRLGPARLTCGRCAARRGRPGAAQCGGGREEKRAEARRSGGAPARAGVSIPAGGQVGSLAGEPPGLPPLRWRRPAPSCPPPPPSSPPPGWADGCPGMARGEPPGSPVGAEAPQEGAGRCEAVSPGRTARAGAAPWIWRPGPVRLSPRTKRACSDTASNAWFPH